MTSSVREFIVDLSIPPSSRIFGGAKLIELWRYPDDSDGWDPAPIVIVKLGGDGILYVDDRPTQFVDIPSSHTLFPNGACVNQGISQIAKIRHRFVPTRILHACIASGMTGVFPPSGCTVVGGDEIWQRGQRSDQRFLPSFGCLGPPHVATFPLYFESLISWSTTHQVLVFRE